MSDFDSPKLAAKSIRYEVMNLVREIHMDPVGQWPGQLLCDLSHSVGSDEFTLRIDWIDGEDRRIATSAAIPGSELLTGMADFKDRILRPLVVSLKGA